MKPSSIALQLAIKPVTLSIFTIIFSSPSLSTASGSFILWLHGLGDLGLANEPIKSVFTSCQLANTRWSFPSAPVQPVTCNHGAEMSSWFDILEIPITVTPILWSHGTADEVVLFEAGQAGPPFLQRLGINYDFKAYPGLDHSVDNQELKHVESWINSRLQCSS